MSATVDVRKADMPTPEELGDVEAIVYVAFEKVEQLAGLVKDYVDDQLGATAEECWLLHFTASYYESWGNSLVERAKELQQHAHDLGLNGLDAGIIAPGRHRAELSRVGQQGDRADSRAAESRVVTREEQRQAFADELHVAIDAIERVVPKAVDHHDRAGEEQSVCQEHAGALLAREPFGH